MLLSTVTFAKYEELEEFLTSILFSIICKDTTKPVMLIQLKYDIRKLEQYVYVFAASENHLD